MKKKVTPNKNDHAKVTYIKATKAGLEKKFQEDPTATNLKLVTDAIEGFIIQGSIKAKVVDGLRGNA